jgi:hypothetical protein
MTMKLENSFKWLAESESDIESILRAGMIEQPEQAVVDVMLSLYRRGWNDCFKLARLHGVERL